MSRIRISCENRFTCVRSTAPINRRSRFAPRFRRFCNGDLLKNTCRADVSICNRKYLHPSACLRVLCNFEAVHRRARCAMWLGHAVATLIIPWISFEALQPLSKTGSSLKPHFDPFSCFVPAKLHRCLPCTLISQRRVTPLLDAAARCSEKKKHLLRVLGWMRASIPIFLSSCYPER